MMPYYSMPFEYYDRKNLVSPQMTAPMAPPMQQPMAPGGTSPMMQFTQPMMQQNLMQPAMPMMQPTMPMTQMPPVCPFTGMPVMPTAGQMGNMGVMGMDMDTDMDTDMEEAEAPEESAPEGITSNRPAAIVTNAPATTTIVMFKELTGYPNYGNPSGNADILYTGTRGTWTFILPPFLFVPGNMRAQIVIRAVLDDHANVPVSRYSARITVNGTVVHTGPLPLEHGVPAGGRFTNWRSLTYNVPNIRRNNSVTIVNTSTAGENDWIAFDWMEMRFTPR
jgi:hypothetical protein